MISIEDVDLKDEFVTPNLVINSPRTLNACEILGLSLSDLDPIDIKSVKRYYKNRDKGKKVP